MHLLLNQIKIMKFLKNFYLVILTIFLFSCSQESSNNTPEILSKVIDVEFNTSTKSKKSNSKSDSTVIQGQIEFTLNDNDENFLDFKFSENVLKELPITEAEFYDLI